MTGTQITLEEALSQAISHHQSGRLGDAEALYRAILQVLPNHPDANHNLGLIAMQVGQAASSLQHFKAALDADPGHQQYRASYAEALIQAGHPDEARRIMDEGSGFKDPPMGARKAASPATSHRLQFDTLRSLFNQGRLGEAEELSRSLMANFPADASKMLGAILSQSGRNPEALPYMLKAVELLPNDAEAHNNLGVTLQNLGRLTDAVASFRNAIRILPDFARAHFNLGNALQEQGRYSDAEAAYRQAIAANPDFTEALGNRGIILCHLGEVKEGVKSLQEALTIDPHNMRTHGKLIFSMDLHPGFDTASQQAERKRWAALHADPLFPAAAYPNDPDPERILRIGYVSADFRNHSAADGLFSLLGNFDRTGFEVYAYSNSRKADRVTETFRKSVTGWRDIHDRSDEEAASLIRRDAIDILVDLSGHTGGDRYLVFARKPAPIQVSAMGYPTGTGMKAMDALFVDKIVVPPEEKHLYAEEIRYLPCVIGYSAKKDYPEVGELPALSQNCLTFGSLNRLTKISSETFALWSRLLKMLPASRMILKAGELDDEAVRERVLRYFAGMEDRVTLLGKTSWLEHVKTYNQVDISLDPFPHGGGVTTIESIRMGAPVLTLKFPTFVGRASASILTTLGLTDWIAESPDEYVKIAIEKSKGLAAIAKLRNELRGIFDASILGDPDYYLRAAEKEYRALWREWCAKQSGAQ